VRYALLDQLNTQSVKGAKMSDPNAQPPVDPTAGGQVPPAGDGQTPPPAPPYKADAPQQPPAGAYPPPPAGGYAPPPPAAGGYPPPPGAPQYQQPYAAAPQMSPSDEKLWSTLIHIGGIFFGFIPPLIGYLVLKDRGPFVRAHTLTALNFQLTMLIAMVVGYILTFIIIGIFIIIAVYVVVIVFSIIAAIKANKGELYSYPLTIQFIKS